MKNNIIMALSLSVCCGLAGAGAVLSGLAGTAGIFLGAGLGVGLAAAVLFLLPRADAKRGSEPDIVELAMSNTSDLVAVVDLEGRRLYNSPSYSLLNDPSKLKGTDSFNEIHPEDREKVREIFRRTVETGKGERTEYRFMLQDGSVRYIESMGNVIKGSDGRPSRVVIVSRDVTERKALEGQLRQAQKMEAMGHLAGGVAHDFNNIITSLAAYADFIARSPGAAGQISEDAAEIKKVCERAAGLSRQLLAFSRKQRLSPKVMDLNGIAGGIQKMLSRLIGANIDLVIEKHTAPVPSLVDPGQIEQVLMNLAVNARDAMPSGGRLSVKVFPCEYTDYLLGSDILPGKYAVISVSDTGTGIAPEVKARIFEPFFTTKNPGAGTGLGLSTAYGIVRQSGGYISVDSEPGKGSVFSVYLPLSERDPENASSTASLPALRRGSETVLLVEDDPVLRSVTRRTLKENGYRVLEAATDSEALLIAEEREKGKIDLILADIVLPGMNGFDLAERVAASNKGIAKVYMSGYTDPEIIKAEFITPQTPLIQKPFTTDTLLFSLRGALEARKKQK
jgi:PAS domain S-box-containing protein